jgi:hypothetical protein
MEMKWFAYRGCTSYTTSGASCICLRTCVVASGNSDAGRDSPTRYGERAKLSDKKHQVKHNPNHISSILYKTHPLFQRLPVLLPLIPGSLGGGGFARLPVTCFRAVCLRALAAPALWGRFGQGLEFGSLQYRRVQWMLALQCVQRGSRQVAE